MPRLLLGPLEPIVRLGLTAVLRDDGAEIVGSEEEPAALALAAGRLQPDAVILGREHAGSREAGELVRAETTQTTVVLWARDEEVMEVVEPGAAPPRRVPSPTPAALCRALAASAQAA